MITKYYYFCVSTVKQLSDKLCVLKQAIVCSEHLCVLGTPLCARNTFVCTEHLNDF